MCVGTAPPPPPPPQNPLAEMSSRAPTAVAVDAERNCSPCRGSRSGSVATSWHTLVNATAQRSRISLWRIVDSPPVHGAGQCVVGVEGACHRHTVMVSLAVIIIVVVVVFVIVVLLLLFFNSH